MDVPASATQNVVSTGQHPLINDELPARIANGSVTVTPDIECFQANGVVTTDGLFHEIDDVIFATGYQIKFPFLPNDVVSVDDNNKPSMLYKHVFPLSLSKTPTLAIIGNVQPLGGLMPIAEMQSRWATRVFKRLAVLPSHGLMMKHTVSRIAELERRYVNSGRHTIQVDYIDYMDSVASEIGVKPKLLEIATKDPELAWQLLVGPGTAYQYRLNGPGKWNGARAAISSQWCRVYSGFGKGIYSRDRGLRHKHAQNNVAIQVGIGFAVVVFITCLLTLGGMLSCF